MREDLVFGDAVLSAAALSPSSRSMPIYIPGARRHLPRPWSLQSKKCTRAPRVSPFPVLIAAPIINPFLSAGPAAARGGVYGLAPPHTSYCSLMVVLMARLEEP